MLAALHDMRARGEAISSLFPATTRLYRGLGYEVAGAWAVRAIPARSLNVLPAGDTGSVRRATLTDLPAIQQVYTRVARRINGHADRPEVWWRRRERHWDDALAFVAEGDDGDVDGFLIYQQETEPAWGYSIVVEDLYAAHADAALALWRVVGSSSMQAEQVRWRGAPEDPLLLLLPEQDLVTRTELRWMLRVVDAPAAVAARGWPVGLKVEVDLELHDRHAGWNDGRWRLVVADGKGALEKGGDGTVRVAAHAFASLWAGYASAHTLARTGLLAGGRDRDLAALDAAFAGPTPWMPDFF